MENPSIVKILNTTKYGSDCNRYGILMQSMEETAVINMNSNKGGIAINISHEDYAVVSPNEYILNEGQVIVFITGGFIRTGLMIY